MRGRTGERERRRTPAAIFLLCHLKSPEEDRRWIWKILLPLSHLFLLNGFSLIFPLGALLSSRLWPHPSFHPSLFHTTFFLQYNVASCHLCTLVFPPHFFARSLLGIHPTLLSPSLAFLLSPAHSLPPSPNPSLSLLPNTAHNHPSLWFRLCFLETHFSHFLSDDTELSIPFFSSLSLSLV